MATMTIEIPDELSVKLHRIQDKLPELLALSLHQPAIPASIYRMIVQFLAGQPTPAQIASFHPTPEMQQRLAVLLSRSQAGTLTVDELAELDEFERIEHLVVMLKAGSLPYVMRAA
jgi:hypothetical protein